MRTVVLILRRRAIAQALQQKLADFSGVQTRVEPDYANADVAIRASCAQAALIEAAEDGEYDIGYCLALCAWLHEEVPDCRLLLLCPESDAEGVRRAAQAEKDGVIQDFVFYDASTDYLVSKVLSL